jgi:hypothetical protein
VSQAGPLAMRRVLAADANYLKRSFMLEQAGPLEMRQVLAADPTYLKRSLILRKIKKVANNVLHFGCSFM